MQGRFSPKSGHYGPGLTIRAKYLGNSKHVLAQHAIKFPLAGQRRSAVATLLSSGAILVSMVAPDSGFAAGLLFFRNHCDLDRLGHYRRVVRYMIGVAEEQLKRVLAQRKLNCCFGLSRSEVQVIEVIRYRLIQRR